MALYAKSLEMRRPAQPRAADRTWQVSSLLVRVPLHSQDSSICIRHDRIIHLKPPWDWISAGQGGATQRSGALDRPEHLPLSATQDNWPRQRRKVQCTCTYPAQRAAGPPPFFKRFGRFRSGGVCSFPPSFSSSATSVDLIGCPSPHRAAERAPPRPSHPAQAPLLSSSMLHLSLPKPTNAE
jgi:hypothetical protein